MGSILRVTALGVVMLEDIWSRFWDRALTWMQEFSQQIASINPTQSMVLWIQIVAGSLTVVWIFVQFAWLRRLNEARLERYLEERITTERDTLAQERAETLAKLDRVSKRRGAIYAILLIWANVQLTLSFVLRMLSLGTYRGLAHHSLLLMQVGMPRRARRAYYDVATDAMKKVRLYEDALNNKRVEAQNALIFSGRIAVAEGLSVAAVSSFKKATRLKDDPEARLLIGQQLSLASDFEGALIEFRTALTHQDIGNTPATRAELHRSIASILMKQGSPGRARQELTRAQALDEPLRDYLGLGKTNELLGDLYAPRARNRRAAEQAYEEAIKNFEHVHDTRRLRAARRKLRMLRKETQPKSDSWITRLLDRCARALMRAAEKRRAQAQMKEG